MKGSSVVGILANAAGGVSSPSGDEGCVEFSVDGEYCIDVAVKLLAVCDFDEGIDARGTLCRLVSGFPGDVFWPEEGEARLFCAAPLVTRIVVSCSSLLPLRELG